MRRYCGYDIAFPRPSRSWSGRARTTYACIYRSGVKLATVVPTQQTRWAALAMAVRTIKQGRLA